MLSGSLHLLYNQSIQTGTAVTSWCVSVVSLKLTTRHKATRFIYKYYVIIMSSVCCTFNGLPQQFHVLSSTGIFCSQNKNTKWLNKLQNNFENLEPYADLTNLQLIITWIRCTTHSRSVIVPGGAAVFMWE